MTWRLSIWVLALTAPAVWADLGVPNAAVRAELSAEWLTAEERSALVRLHGLWDDEDLQTADDRLMAQLVMGDPRGAVSVVPDASPRLQARWWAARGDFENALRLLEFVEPDAEDELLRGDMLLALGRADEAREAFEAAVPDERTMTRTAAVTAMRRLAEMDEAQGQSYQNILRAYQAVAATDPRDWTSRLAEAQFLFPRRPFRARVDSLRMARSAEISRD